MKRINNKNIFYIIIVALVLVLITSCGCGGNNLSTYSSIKESLMATQLNEMKSSVESYCTEKGVDGATTKDKLATITYDFKGDNMKEVLLSVLKDVDSEDVINEKVDFISSNVVNQLVVSAKASLPSFYDESKLKRHQKAYCEADLENTSNLLDSATIATTANVNEKKAGEDVTNVYQIMSNYYLKINEDKASQGPIRVYSFKQDGFFSALFNDALVFPIGWLMYIISYLLGGYYFLGILIITILFRFILMPVYNSSNDMQLKQQLMQPEMKKIEEKYALRKDQESQRAKQMEQAQLMKKYKTGLSGCLPMLLQLPVFIAVYNAVSRMRFTDGSILNSPDWALKLKTKVFGIDLFLTRGNPDTWQFWGIIILLVLVVGTQIFQQIMTQKIQKWTYAKSQEDIPAYKRQAYQQNQQGNSMKFMMYFMIAMMGLFVFQSAAALGVYWLIGNIFSIVQMFINYKNSAKRLEKLKIKLHLVDAPEKVITVKENKKEKRQLKDKKERK